MGNYPAGVTDNDPHFDLPNANDDEDADDAAEAVLRRCAKCGRPFNYPPSDNKSDATLCAWCDPVLSPQPVPNAEGPLVTCNHNPVPHQRRPKCSNPKPWIAVVPQRDAGEWLRDGSTVYELTNDGRGGRVNHWSANVQGPHLQRGEAEQIAARIVSDHTQAAAVPKLVEALQRRVSPTKCYCDVMLGAKCGECADRELLTSLGAQIQEKQ